MSLFEIAKEEARRVAWPVALSVGVLIGAYWSPRAPEPNKSPAVWLDLRDTYILQRPDSDPAFITVATFDEQTCKSRNDTTIGILGGIYGNMDERAADWLEEQEFLLKQERER